MTDAPGDAGPLELVDAHCHVDLFPDPRSVAAAAARGRVHTIAVTNAPSVFFHTRNLCRENPYTVAAVGLHPELVRSHGGELERMWPHLDETRFVGEVGLDYVTGDQALRRRQRDVFSAILTRCASHGDKILTVHSRRSATDVIAAVGPDFPGAVILHWFSGSGRELERAADIGCWFSVNPSMAASRSGRALIAAMPRDRVLTETDGPFVKLRGDGARPTEVTEAVAGLAATWGLPVTDTAAAVLRNFRRLLASPG